jgi:hypothetical protein
MLDEADDTVSYYGEETCNSPQAGVNKTGGATKCLNPAIDFKATCGSMRVDASPKARPTAKRLQFRRGCRHLVTLELERATADIAC